MLDMDTAPHDMPILVYTNSGHWHEAAFDQFDLWKSTAICGLGFVESDLDGWLPLPGTRR